MRLSKCISNDIFNKLILEKLISVGESDILFLIRTMQVNIMIGENRSIIYMLCKCKFNFLAFDHRSVISTWPIRHFTIIFYLQMFTINCQSFTDIVHCTNLNGNTFLIRQFCVVN